MIPALIAVLSAPGVWLAWWLMRPVRSARDLLPYEDDPNVISYGFDYTGLVD